MQRIKNVIDRMFFGPTESPIERIVIDLLNDNKIKHETQKKIGKYFADIVVGDLVIECDGAEFHKETNHGRNDFLKRSGFTVKHYSGREINYDPTIILKDIWNHRLTKIIISI